MITHYDSCVAITTSDTTVYEPPLDAIYIGGAGNLTVKTPGATAAVTLTAVPVGSIIPVRARNVMAATTATLLIGLRAGPPLA